MSLATARADVAAALSAVSGWTVHTKPGTAAPRAGEGWVTVTRVAPSGFSNTTATLAVFLVLGANEGAAWNRLSDDAVALLTAVTDADTFRAGDVYLEPSTVAVGDTATPLYGAVLTLTLEV